MKKVIAYWMEQIEYYVNIKCPNCNENLNEEDLYSNLGIEEGNEFMGEVKCHFCKKKFLLKLKEK